MISFDLRIWNKLILREYFVSFPGKCDSSPSMHADNVNNKFKHLKKMYSYLTF